MAMWFAPPLTRVQACLPQQLGLWADRQRSSRGAFSSLRTGRSREQRCRAAAGGEGGGTPPELRAAARQLEKLFYAAESGVPQPAPPAQDASSGGHVGAVLHDLPLWRVQWAVLPGFQNTLHVHVPHYADMFSRLFATPRPWRFGHLYLPEGSKNLGNPEYALEPGSKAPLLGTLMEVLQVVRFPDGRILLLAAGVARFRVLRAGQVVPHSRADVELVPDAEELEAREESALGTLGELPGGASMLEAMQAGQAATVAAAAAAAQVWQEYELADARVLEAAAIIDGENEVEAMSFGHRLLDIGANEVLPLPFDSAAAAAAASGSGGQAAGSGEVPEGASAAGHASAWQADRRALGDAAILAEDAAREAAAAALAHLKPQQRPGEAAADAAAADRARGLWAPAAINRVQERGLPVRAADPALDPEEDPQPANSTEAVLWLEADVWREIDALSILALKLRGHHRPLAAGLQCLRPAPALQQAQQPALDPGSPAEEQACAHPGYPAMRRAQRLSFAVATLLGDVSSEGRQTLLEAHRVAARLQLALTALRRNRAVLAAVVAVQDLGDSQQ